MSIQMSVIKVCTRCGTKYDYRRSLAALKMTYCSTLCEGLDLGFDLKAATKPTVSVN